MRPVGRISLVVMIAMAQLAAAAGRAACLSGPDTRDAVQTRRIVPPFRAVAEAMREGGDLVGIRICPSPDPPLVYDVAVLRRDGRLVHVIVDAGSGQSLPGRREP